MMSNQEDPRRVAVRSRQSLRREGWKELHPRGAAGAGKRKKKKWFSIFRCLRKHDSASDDETKQGEWNSNPYIRSLFCGVYDSASPLSILRGQESAVLKHICQVFVGHPKECVTLTPAAHTVARFGARLPRQSWQEGGEDDHDDEGMDSVEFRGRRFRVVTRLASHGCHHDSRIAGGGFGILRKDRPKIAFSPCGQVQFPAPQSQEERKINMMPFVMGQKESLPEELHLYYDALIAKCPVDPSELGQVCYLTIHESHCERGMAQRRTGLHVDVPGTFRGNGGSFAAAVEMWGMGWAWTPDKFVGGMFVASNMNDTAAVWNAIIDTNQGHVNPHGGAEILRPYIGSGWKVPANTLVWLTDRTPHESLPLPVDGHRQFFRLVTSRLSVWYAAHSTPNPKIALPERVKIIYESKF